VKPHRTPTSVTIGAMAEVTNEPGGEIEAAVEIPARARMAPRETCDLCGSEMRPMGHCKYQCMACGFMLTCHDRF
jgi:hypothetical protein